MLGYRYYDPSAGRFLTRDPAGFTGGVNLYTYCSNAPVGNSDPSGEEGQAVEFDGGNYFGVIVGCGTGIVGLINQYRSSGGAIPSVHDILCTLGASCGGAILGIVLAAGSGAAAVALSCLEGALGALLASITSSLCTPVGPCQERSGWCVLGKAVFEGIYGCGGGALAKKVTSIVLAALVGTGFNMWSCDHKAPGCP